MGRAPSLPQDPGFRRRSGTIPVEAERPPWERPWPRHGCCRPPASIKVAIASKLAPTVFGADLGGETLWTAVMHRRDFDPAPRTAHRRCRGQKTPPTGPRLRPWVGHIPSHTTPATGRARSLWERPWPRRGCCGPPASMKVAIASKLAPTVFDGGLGKRPWGRPALLPTGPQAGAAHCPPPLSGSEDPSHKTTASAMDRAHSLPHNPGRGSGTIPMGAERPLWERSGPCGSGLGRDAAVAGSTKTKGADGAFCSCKGGVAAPLTSAARAAATGCVSRCGCRRGRLRG